MIIKPFQNISTTSFKPQDLYLWASRESNLAREEVWSSWIVEQGCKAFLSIPHGTVYDYYVEKDSFMAIHKKIAKKIVENWEKHLQNYKHSVKTMVVKAQELVASISTNDRKIILKFFLEYIKSLYQFSEYIHSPWSIIYVLEPEILQRFPQQQDLIMSLEEPIQYFKMQEALHTFPLSKVVDNFSWMKIYTSYDKIYTEEELKYIKKETSAAELQKQKEAFANNKKKFAQVLMTIKDQKLRRQVEVVNKYAFLKTDRVDAWKQQIHASRPFYEYLTKVIPAFALEDTTNLTNQEIISFLSDNQLPSLEAKRRKEGKSMYYYHDHQLEIISGEIVFKTIEKLQGDLSVKELSGTIACPGKIKGKVVVINSPKDLKKVEAGDIFIAKFTYPLFTPYMIKAAAIVTDDGGITSHAAIISREYKKPCIVGTKKATLIFKDGDLVEVDANKGSISLMKHP